MNAFQAVRILFGTAVGLPLIGQGCGSDKGDGDLKASPAKIRMSAPLFALLLCLSALALQGLVGLQHLWRDSLQAQADAQSAREMTRQANIKAALLRHIDQMPVYEAPAAAASQIARFARARAMNDLVTGSLPDFKIAAALAIPLRRDEVARAVEVYAHAEGIPVMLAAALVKSESGYNPLVRNKGAQGLMQIKLITARKVGYMGDENGLLDPLTNLEFGMRHLAQIYRMANRDPCRTIAIYRSGNPQARPTQEQMAVCAKSRG